MGPHRWSLLSLYPRGPQVPSEAQPLALLCPLSPVTSSPAAHPSQPHPHPRLCTGRSPLVLCLLQTRSLVSPSKILSPVTFSMHNSDCAFKTYSPTPYLRCMAAP